MANLVVAVQDVEISGAERSPVTFLELLPISKFLKVLFVVFQAAQVPDPRRSAEAKDG